MDNSDKIKFAQIMTSMSEMYSKEISKDLMLMYFNALKHFTINQVSEGFSQHLVSDNGQFFPKPADIARQFKSDDSAEAAWSEIVNKISSVGSYGNLEMKDKNALAAVQSLGGWKHICYQTVDQLVWLKKEFMNIYNTNGNKCLPEFLAGRIELDTNKPRVNGTMKELELRSKNIKES